MVSTRQQSNVGGSGGDNSGSESGGGSTKSIRNMSTASTSQEIVLAGANTTCESSLKLTDLPPEILEKIFKCLGYQTVAQLRLVCRGLDRACSQLLNSTFQRLQTQMLARFQAIKAKMPRRESARRNHPLACESDIIETLHMRLTLLQMSFGKHIERKHCCFFAGEILDEVYRILHYIRVTPKLARPYKVTDELFDLSTMAMEYFKEYIEPTLPEIAYFGSDFLDFASTLPSASASKYVCLDSPNKSGDESPRSGDEQSPAPPPPQCNMVLRKRIRRIKMGMRRYNSQLSVLRREMRQCKSKITDQQKQIVEYASRLDEYDKKNEENSRKFSTLLQELNKCKTELQYWRSKSSLNPVCVSCGQVVTSVSPIEDIQALTNQGVILPDLPQQGCSDCLQAAALTSGDEIWATLEREAMPPPLPMGPPPNTPAAPPTTLALPTKPTLEEPTKTRQHAAGCSSATRQSNSGVGNKRKSTSVHDDTTPSRYIAAKRVRGSLKLRSKRL